mgnify:CR=1 FL=1
MRKWIGVIHYFDNHDDVNSRCYARVSYNLVDLKEYLNKVLYDDRSEMSFLISIYELGVELPIDFNRLSIEKVQII